MIYLFSFISNPFFVYLKKKYILPKIHNDITKSFWIKFIIVYWLRSNHSIFKLGKLLLNPEHGLLDGHFPLSKCEWFPGVLFIQSTMPFDNKFADLAGIV